MSSTTFGRMPVAAESLDVIAATSHGTAGGTRHRIKKLASGVRPQSRGLMEAHQALLLALKLPYLVHFSHLK
jgi:hypothetical protein